MLISYLGIDFQNRGDRVYRLLDCTMTFMKLFHEVDKHSGMKFTSTPSPDMAKATVFLPLRVLRW